MSKLLIGISLIILSGCGKFTDMVATGTDGYVVRCIEGSKFVLISTDHGQAITPLLMPDGKVKSCKE